MVMECNPSGYISQWDCENHEPARMIVRERSSADRIIFARRQDEKSPQRATPLGAVMFSRWAWEELNFRPHAYQA